MDTLGARIKETRERQLMTQADLANVAGVALITVNRLENDAIESPRPSTIKSLAAALGVNAQWLRFGDDEIKKAA